MNSRERFQDLTLRVESDILENPHLNDQTIAIRCNTTREFVRRQRKHLKLMRRI